jgi:hypothetical protein
MAMLGTTQNPSTRILVKSLLCASLAVFALLGALVLPGAARAAEPVAGQTPEATPPAEPVAPQASEPTPPAEPVAPPAPEPIPPAVPAPEPTPPAVPAPEPTPPAAPAPEPTPPAAPAPEPTPPAAPAPGPTPPTEPTPPTGPTTGPTKEDPLLVEPITERTKEATPTGPTTGQAAESLPASPAAAPQSAAPPNDPADPVIAEVSSALIGSTTTDPTASNTGGLWAVSTASAASIEAPPQFTVGQRAAGLGCELSGLAGPVAYGCTVVWLGGRSFLSRSTVDIATQAAARVAVPAGDADSGYGSSGGSRSTSPPPGPAPGGAFGGSATGGSGMAISGFFSLAGLLRRAAPRAMRRLRLSCQPWLTAFFVLIPERPG